MKNRAIFIFLLHFGAVALCGQSVKLFDDTRVSSIHIQLPADSLKKMLDELVNDRYMPAQFVFDFPLRSDAGVGARSFIRD